MRNLTGVGLTGPLDADLASRTGHTATRFGDAFSVDAGETLAAGLTLAGIGNADGLSLASFFCDDTGLAGRALNISA